MWLHFNLTVIEQLNSTYASFLLWDRQRIQLASIRGLLAWAQAGEERAFFGGGGFGCVEDGADFGAARKFRDVAVGAEFEGFLDVGAFVGGGEDHGQHVDQIDALPEPFENAESIHAGQAEIEKDDERTGIPRVFFQIGDGAFAIGHDIDRAAGAGFFQQASNEKHGVGIVFDDEDRTGRSGRVHEKIGLQEERWDARGGPPREQNR